MVSRAGHTSADRGARTSSLRMALRSGDAHLAGNRQAAASTLTSWERLTRFVDDPRILLDNNATSAAHGIRSVVRHLERAVVEEAHQCHLLTNAVAEGRAQHP